MGYLATGTDPIRRGNEHPTSVPNGLFHSATGPFYIAVGNPRLWQRFCERVIDRPNFVDGPPYGTRLGRLENRAELYKVLGEIFAGDTRDNWLRKLDAAGVPGGAVRTVSEAFAAPETKAREMIVKVPHPTAGEIEMIASPLKFSDTPVVEPTAPPLLGQHTDAVLAELLGLDEAARKALRDSHVIR